MSSQSLLYKPKKRRRAAPCAAEHDEQAALFAWWARTRWAADGIIMHAIPNGGARDVITGARLKAEGVLAGVPDIFLAARRGGYGGLYVEMKKRTGGRVSDTQKQIIPRLMRQGYPVVIARGWDEARKAIEAYLTEKWQADGEGGGE